MYSTGGGAYSPQSIETSAHVESESTLISWFQVEVIFSLLPSHPPKLEESVNKAISPPIRISY